MGWIHFADVDAKGEIGEYEEADALAAEIPEGYRVVDDTYDVDDEGGIKVERWEDDGAGWFQVAEISSSKADPQYLIDEGFTMEGPEYRVIFNYLHNNFLIERRYDF